MTAQGILSRDEVLQAVEGLGGRDVVVRTPYGPRWGALQAIDPANDVLWLGRYRVPFEDVLEIREDTE